MHLTGVSALLMHRPVSVNPLDEGTKTLKKYTGKRTKTSEDHEVIARLEWALGLYHDPDIGPYIPGVNVEIMLRDAGKLDKKGASITRGVIVSSDKLPLIYKGPRATEQELWDANLKDIRSVGNQKNRVMRCRPMFPQWELDVDLLVEETIIDPSDVVDIARKAGLMIGLGDYRPRFGRFTVQADV